MMIRMPVVAGQFYPSEPKILIEYLEKYIPKDIPKAPALGIVVPHAGYMYSGSVAGSVYGSLLLPDTFIILGPNHTGIGESFAVMSEGSWQTPLGTVNIDKTLAHLILTENKIFTLDPIAHRFEHSIEVQLPFLQYLKKDFSFVPIMLSHAKYRQCETLGQTLAQAIHKFNKPILIIASSDMTHYEAYEIAKKKDNLAIEQILALEPEKLYQTVHTHNITMCGIIPTTVMLIATKALGAKKAKLVTYATSGDISGDYAQVVGYTGIIIK
jgi:hypothetical protein